MARHDRHSQITTFVLDSTANAAIYAIAAHAEERETHLRNVELYGQNLPENSYGRTNRQIIPDHETRIAVRLHAVEHESTPRSSGTLCPRLPSPLEHSTLPGW